MIKIVFGADNILSQARASVRDLELSITVYQIYIHSKDEEKKEIPSNNLLYAFQYYLLTILFAKIN